MQFKLYICSIHDFKLSGLELYDNIYSIPQKYIDLLVNKTNTTIYLDATFILTFDPDVVKGTFLEDYFKSESTVYVNNLFDLPHYRYNPLYEDIKKHWMGLFLKDDCPFYWESELYSLQAISHNNLEFAEIALEYWKSIENYCKTHKEITELAEKIDSLQYALKQKENQLKYWTMPDLKLGVDNPDY